MEFHERKYERYYIYTDGEVDISSSSFWNFSSTGDGGAIYSERNIDSNIYLSDFLFCSCVFSGGAIRSKSGDVNLSKICFIQNKAGYGNDFNIFREIKNLCLSDISSYKGNSFTQHGNAFMAKTSCLVENINSSSLISHSSNYHGCCLLYTSPSPRD